jgi:hypothetical protein
MSKTTTSYNVDYVYSERGINVGDNMPCESLQAVCAFLRSFDKGYLSSYKVTRYDTSDETSIVKEVMRHWESAND